MSNTHEGATYSTNNTGVYMKRNSALLMILLMLTSCIPISIVSATGESLSFNTFTGGYALSLIHI